MGLRMKNYGGLLKNPIFRGEVHEKPMYREELPKKGVWTVCKFKGGAWHKGGSLVFLKGAGYPNAHYEIDSLLHKTRIRVPRLDMCPSMISLSKIAHLKCDSITHSAKETRQQNEQWGWGWRQHGRGGEQNLKKGEGRQYRGGLHKIGGLGSLCQP